MKKKGFWKVFIFGLMVSVSISFLAKSALAQVALNTQVMLQNSLAVPLGDADDPDAYLVDNFEYFSSPRNMGWNPIEPAYPVWGYGLGYAELTTVLDFEEGSRVLDSKRPFSVFLIETPYKGYSMTKYTKYYDEDTEEAEDIPGTYCVFSVMMRMPFGYEWFQMPSAKVTFETESEKTISIKFIARQDAYNAEIKPTDEIDDNTTITVLLGRDYQDSSWHFIVKNLEDILDAHVNDDGENVEDIAFIKAVTLGGNSFRADNVMFTNPCKSILGNSAPHLFRIGPIYGQLWNVMQTFWIMAEDDDLGMHMSINEDGDYVFDNIFYFLNPDEDCEAEESEQATFCIGCEEGSLGVGGLELDIADPDDMDAVKIIALREDESDDCDPPKVICNDGDCVIDADDANLNFQFNVGDTLGSCAFLMARPISCVPEGDDDDADEGTWPFSQAKANNFPPYLLQEDGVIIPNLPETRDYYTEDEDEQNEDTEVPDNAIYMRSMTNPMYVLAVALYNSDHEVFPNVRALNPTMGQTPEDLIVTCRVTDGVATDKETFPVSVVNYPVTNFPPMLNDLDDQLFYVMESPSPDKGVNVYQVMATDHDMQDMFSLTYNCTLNGLPNYQVGPFQQRIISPTGGLIAFTPYSEGALQAIITVEDPRGMYAVGAITIFCCNRGTWFNHPPIILHDLDSPQTIRAGQLFVADEMNFVDPDGDELYWSCNIGAIGDNGLYTFQSQYPGYYMVQITAYDIRGGAATTEFMIHVLPWWAY